jgi:16S rRNA processing protein RimM
VLEVGRVVRPHGLGGRVVVELWTNRTERIAAGARLFAGDRPLEVLSASPIKPAGWPRYLVAFAGLENPAMAEDLRDTVLLAEPLEVEGALWVHEMVGADLYDEERRLVGHVEAVEANPASDLLVLSDGRLVPLTFVRTDGDRLVVDAPPGLLDEG